MSSPSTPSSSLEYREMSVAVERAALETRAAGDERIPIAISSEAPYERYDWMTGKKFLEVLDHSAIDLSKARDGLPFLVEHSRGAQVGLVEDVAIGADRRLRGVVRFSRSAAGQEIKQDMLDGIRLKISVGYRVSDDYDQTDGEGTALPTRRYKNWTPMEASSVSIPADYEVGVGRSAGGAAPRGSHVPPASSASQAKEYTVSDSVTATPGGAATPEVRVGASAPDTRVADILAIAAAHKRPIDQALAWVNSGKSAAEVGAEVLRDYQNGITKLNPPTPGASLTLTESEEKRYSMVRAIQSLMDNKREGFEFEVSDQIAKDLGKTTRGVLVPTTLRATLPGAASAQDALRIAQRYDTGLATRTQLSIAAGAGKGVESKFTEFQAFIDLLRARATVFGLGAQMLPGLQGDPGFVDQTGTGTATWGTETANAGLSSLSTALRTMTPKVLQSATSYSRQLLSQSVLSIENLVRSDIATLHALAIDSAAISGSGAASQPRGILNTAGIGAVAGGANGAQPTYDNVVQLQKAVAVGNAFFGAMAYLSTPGIAARLMLTQKFATTNGDPVWGGNMLNGSVVGFTAQASTQVPSTLTKGTSSGVCHAIIFGAFDQILVGEWGAMELIVDPYTIGPALVKLMSIQMVDVFIRYAASFAAMQDALQ